MNLTRRSLLKTSAAGIALSATGLPALAQIDELVIAYNVNLPSWDPTVGPSAVNPTIQGLYQSVFDQYILQQPDLTPAPGLLTAWGWNDDKTQVWMDVREGVKWHDGSDFTAEDVAWSLARAADPGHRQPDPVRLGDARQPPRRGQPGDRRCRAVRPHDLQVDVLPHRLCPAEGLLREGRRRRVRGKAHRHRPLHGRELRAQRLRAAEGQPRLLGRGARIRERDHPLRDRRRLPRGRGRIGQQPMSPWKSPTRNTTA
jgi:hypothetical protein